MTAEPPPPPVPEDDDVQAGELALGVLSDDDRAAAMRRRLAEPAFAASVSAWEDRLSPLFGLFATQAPPERVWQGIAARLDNRKSRGATGEVAQLRFWRATTAVASLVAATLLLILTLRPEPAAPPVERPVAVQPGAIAQLASEDGDQIAAAQIDAPRALLRIRAIALPEAGAPELWVIPADGTPRSLGGIGRSGVTNVAIGQQYRRLIADGAVLAVSLEEASGMPHAAPAGPIVATGTITAI